MSENKIFVEIKDVLINLEYILSVEKVDRCDLGQFSRELTYSIIINKSENKNIFYSNTLLDYKDRIERDLAFDSIKKLLREERNITIKKI